MQELLENNILISSRHNEGDSVTKKIREISIKNQREKSRDLPCCDVMDMIVQ